MIPVLLIIAVSFVLGFLAVRSLAPRAGTAISAGAAFPLGISIAAFLLFGLTVLGVSWSRSALAIATLVAATAFVLIAARRHPAAEDRDRSISVSLLDAGWLLLLAGYTRYAVGGPIAEYDFLGIWGVKAKTFFLERGIDFGWLAHPWQDYTHPDYPLLVPLAYDVVAVTAGEWSDRWIGMLFPAFAASVLLVIRAVLERDSGSPHLAALGTIALVPFAASPYLGLAEGPLIAFGTIALLLLREAIQRDRMDLVTLGAVFLGLAANAKNEGLTLALAAAVALVAAGRWRVARYLWPAAALVAPWVAARAMFGLTTDLARGSVVERLWSHLRQPGVFVEAIAAYPLGKRLFWVGVTVALVLLVRMILRRDRFLLAALAVQYGFFVLAYLATPHEVDWHFKWSWERVVNQLTLLLGFVVVAALLETIRRRGGANQPDG